MIKEEITIDQFIDKLNEILNVDAEAMSNLVKNRVECNETLAHYPDVQCGMNNKKFEIGMLGLFNGFFGSFDDGPRKGWGSIAAIIGDDGIIKRFERLENK